MKKNLLKKIIVCTVIATIFFNSTVYASTWSKVGDKWNLLDENGTKLTGWQYDDDSYKYYLDNNGNMLTGWQYLNGAWYYLNPNGVRKTDWLYDKGHWYYLDSASGRMITGSNQIDGAWYYFYDSGYMAANTTIDGWQYSADGALINYPSDNYVAIGWKKLFNGDWRYYQSDGEIKKGWLYDRGYWYYLTDDGSMAIGWKQIDLKWYYFNNNGAMAVNKTIDGWELGANGAWIVNTNTVFSKEQIKSLVRMGWGKSEENIHWEFGAISYPFNPTGFVYYAVDKRDNQLYYVALIMVSNVHEITDPRAFIDQYEITINAKTFETTCGFGTGDDTYGIYDNSEKYDDPQLKIPLF